MGGVNFMDNTLKNAHVFITTLMRWPWSFWLIWNAITLYLDKKDKFFLKLDVVYSCYETRSHTFYFEKLNYNSLILSWKIQFSISLMVQAG